MALRGVRVLELAGLAPVPFCGMILSDFGANVIRVDRTNTRMDMDTLGRGKRSIALDLKNDRGRALFKRMADKSDVLLDPYRPGVLEAMGIGPSELHRTNPGLIIARITGYGQDGPMSKAAGHDINYVATSGLLSMLGKAGTPPSPPVNFIADFAGGGLLAAMGICAALFERNSSGKGQVIDTSMTEGAAYVASFLWRTRTPKAGIPIWFTERGGNLLDGGAHFYQTYETSDGKYMAVGALEPQFYAEFVRGLGIEKADDFPQMQDMAEATAEVARIFKTKTQAKWTKIYKGTDACVTPVLEFDQVADHEQHKARNAFLEYEGALCPQPAPRLSRTPAQAVPQDPRLGEHTLQVLEEFGLDQTERDQLIQNGVVQVAKSKI